MIVAIMKGHNKNQLRKTRKTAGVNVRDLADAAGISPRYVYLIERGERKPSPPVAERLAAFLGKKPGDIFLPKI